MSPFLHFGELTLSTYRLITALAAVMGAGLIYRRLIQDGFSSRQVIRSLIIAFLTGVFAAYLAQFAINAWRAMQGGDMIVREGRSVIWSGVGVMLGVVIASRRYKVALLRGLDRAVAPIILAQSLARWGCFARGCCGGKPTDSRFGVFMPNEYGVWAYRYPTQVMSAAINFAIFLLLIAIERYARTRAKKEGLDHLWPFDGFLVALYLLFFGLKRFFMAFLRESATPLLGPMSLMHIQALALLLIGGGLLLLQWRRHLVSSPTADEAAI